MTKKKKKSKTSKHCFIDESHGSVRIRSFTYEMYKILCNNDGLNDEAREMFTWFIFWKPINQK